MFELPAQRPPSPAMKLSPSETTARGLLVGWAFEFPVKLIEKSRHDTTTTIDVRTPSTFRLFEPQTFGLRYACGASNPHVAAGWQFRDGTGRHDMTPASMSGQRRPYIDPTAGTSRDTSCRQSRSCGVCSVTGPRQSCELTVQPGDSVCRWAGTAGSTVMIELPHPTSRHSTEPDPKRCPVSLVGDSGRSVDQESVGGSEIVQPRHSCYRDTHTVSTQILNRNSMVASVVRVSLLVRASTAAQPMSFESIAVVWDLRGLHPDEGVFDRD